MLHKAEAVTDQMTALEVCRACLARRLTVATVVTALIGACTGHRSQQPGAAVSTLPVAIVGASVIDPSATPAERRNHTIVVVDGRISAIGPTPSTPIPRNARRIDATDKYVIPGLWDAHVHFMNTGVTALPMLVANGVTSVREMGGYLDSTRAWQERIQAGTLIGPRMITPGGMLENPRYLAGVRERSARAGGRLATRVLPYRAGVADSTAARRVIDSLVALRVDFVKFRTVASPEAFFAILREAHRAGLKVAGHLPGVVSLSVAADSGLDDLEHALGIEDSTVRHSVTQRFAGRRIWYTPTLVVSRAVTVSGDSSDQLIFGPHALDLEAARPYASPWLLEWWRIQVDERMDDTSHAVAAQTIRAFRASREDVRSFAAAGVRILAGTDAGSVLIYPGFSLHDELALLVEAGLTPQQALWSASAGPAQFAGLESIVGTLAVGQAADLVLLDANPLSDIRNTR